MPRKPKKIEESPLLSGSSDSRGEGGKMASTVHPERFDMTRFSERRDEEESSFRIILYVIVVVAIGVGLALLVRYLISNNTESTEDTPEDTTEEVEESAFDINTLTQADSLAEDAPTEADFTTAEETIIGSEEAVASGLNLSAIAFDRYTTFARLEFTLDGVTEATEVPITTINYDASAQEIEVILDADITVDTTLTTTETIAEVVETVSYDGITNTFSIFLSDETPYVATTTATGFRIDLQAEDESADEDTTEETPETSEDETSETETEEPDPNRPTGVSYDNDFGSDKQFITSEVTGNTIAQNTFFYEDAGEYFEFAWGSTNKVGDDYVPNATAEYVTEGGTSYIEVTLDNLSEEAFQNYNITGTNLDNTNLDLSATPFVRVDRVSFEGGTATYRIQVSRQTTFRLFSEPTVDGTTQVIGIQIRD